MKKITAYHGTLWEKHFNCLSDDFETEHNQLHAAFFASAAKIASFFGLRNFVDEESQVGVVIQSELTINKYHICEPTFQGVIQFNHQEYNLTCEASRAELHDALRDAGYQALIMKNSYHADGEKVDDIAILDKGCIKVQAIRFDHHVGFTDWMTVQAAKEKFSEWENAFEHSFQEFHKLESLGAVPVEWEMGLDCYPEYHEESEDSNLYSDCYSY